MSYLDDGVLFEILVRLPVKSLLRFKCVDRRWNSFISDSRFAKAQVRMSTSNTSQRLHLHDHRGGFSVSFEDIMSGWPENSALRLDGLGILCSCHGLVCFLDDLDRFVLYNPATMTRRELPINHYIERKTWFIRGLGYDTLNDDYKLVIGTFHNYGRCAWEFHVFSLRSNSWRRIGGLDFCCLDSYGRYSNGFLHWLRGGYRGMVSFNIATEQLHEDLLPMPVFTNPGEFTQWSVTECGWLVIYHNSPNASEFWIMKDSCRGSNSTWTKLCCITDEQLKYDLSIHLKKKYDLSYKLWFPSVRNGKIFLLTVWRSDRIGVYDPEEKYLKTIQVPKNHSPLYSYHGIPHTLSLVHPHV